MHSWGKFMNKNIHPPHQKNATFEAPRAKAGYHNQTMGKPPKPPLHLIPTLSLYKEGACPAQKASKGTGCLLLPPPAAIRAPIKPCLNVLSGLFINFCWLRKASLVAQLVKNLPAMQETKIQSLGREDTLEKGMATSL